MGFFIDKENRRKSPIALAAFGAGIVNLLLFGILYGFLAEPLYHLIAFESADWTNIVHSVIIALLGTGVCCLWFLLPDKRVAPYGFVCLALLLVMFLLATLLQESEARNLMLYIVAMYGVAPVVIGNAAIWAIYLAWTRRHPAARRKTLREELQEGIDREAKRKKPSPAPASAAHAAAPAEQAKATAASAAKPEAQAKAQASAAKPEASAAKPEAQAKATKPAPEASAEEDEDFPLPPQNQPNLAEEAMLFYSDDPDSDES